MEAALADTVRKAVEAAYARSDPFERRRVLMQEWADHLAATRQGDGQRPEEIGREGARTGTMASADVALHSSSSTCRPPLCYSL